MRQTGAAIYDNPDGNTAGLRCTSTSTTSTPGSRASSELGGEANEPLPVPGMGWFVGCKDAVGNEFGLWQTDPNAPGA